VAEHLASHHPEVAGPASSSHLVGYECRACHLYQMEGESHLLKHIHLRHSGAREPSVELIAGPVPAPQDSPSPEYIIAPSPDLTNHDQVTPVPGVDGDTNLTSTGLTRCNMCPSPGLVHKDQAETHLRDHTTALFTCAPCNKKFELYQDVENHVKVKHKVSSASSVCESIILPSREKLLILQCGVCSRQFVGQAEQVLVSHIETSHGKYYVGMGGGKNIVRKCRLCGELGVDGGNMIRHLESEHGSDIFASDSDNTDNEETEPIPAHVPTKTTSTKVAFIDIFKEEVARRKAEYDRKELEKKKMKRDLSSVSGSTNTSGDNTESDTDVKEVDMEKRKKKERVKHKKIKARQYYSSDSEEQFEDLRKFKRKSYSKNDDQRKRLKKKETIRKVEMFEKDHNCAKLKGSKEHYFKEKRGNGRESCSDSDDYKYKCHNSYKSSNKDDLIRKKPVKSNEKNLVIDKVQDYLDIQLKQSSTDKLLEAKELVRVTIQKEENSRLVKQKNASLLSCDAKKLSDLVKLKQQLSETLKKSKVLTQRMKKKHKDKNTSREREHEDNPEPEGTENKDNRNDLYPVSSSKTLLFEHDSSSKSTSDDPDGNCNQKEQPAPPPEQKSPRFTMTWRKQKM